MLLAFSSGPAAAAAGCESSGDLHFICGAEQPEDLARVPGTRWLIASGFSAGSGLKLIDTVGRSAQRWYTGSAAQIRPDARQFPQCPGPPDAQSFNAQGLNLRPVGDRQYRLRVANHGGRETVEVFDIDARQPVPALRWRGCLPLPQGLAANSVAAYSDGTTLITVLARPGHTYADFVNGLDTGGVYEWRPALGRFVLIPGSELPGNNGLETAADDSGFFVVAFGRHSIRRYQRDGTHPVESVAPGFMPDNVHWDGGRLIAAGMSYDEPACGGVRKVIDGVADAMRCHRGFTIAELDPSRMTFQVLVAEPPNAVFNGVSAAVLIDGTYWIGSYQADRLAYRRESNGGTPPVKPR